VLEVRQTHDLVFGDDHVVKRYRSWYRGEHVREWTVLRAAARGAPDLVPRPLEAGLADDPPWVTMSRLRGEPLDGVLSAMQLDALELALRRLWSVPVGDLPPRRFHPEEASSVIGGALANSVRPDGVAGQAYDVCVAQLQPADLSGRLVIGHGDANLANYLWDGVSIRLVDFEDAGVSSVEYELGFLVEHLSGRGTDWDSFLRRFDTDEARLRSARLTSAAHWLLLLLDGPATRCNPAGTLDEQARHILSLA
jgi:aminoglycoside phosphotransferase